MFQKEKPRILFISRAYPPITGGIENQNYELSVWLPKLTRTKTLANTKGKKALPFFLPFVSLKALFLLRNYDAVLLGDGVLAIVGWFLKLFHHKPVICITHGLDLTFKNWLYQKLWVAYFIPKMDKLIAVGNETIRVGVERKIPQEKFVFIPNGVDTEKFIATHTKVELEKIVGEKLENKKILLTTGRLAVHKGVDWFCENIIPKLGSDIIYLIAGDGEKRNAIEKIIIEKKLASKVKMLGRVSDKDLNILYNTANLYIKPNIKVIGTMEGFGLVVIEAASCELTVIASDLEGLKDAIKDGENGFLVEPENAKAWTDKINELLQKDEKYLIDFGKRARQYAIENYAWGKISRQYLEEIKKTKC